MEIAGFRNEGGNKKEGHTGGSEILLRIDRHRAPLLPMS